MIETTKPVSNLTRSILTFLERRPSGIISWQPDDGPEDQQTRQELLHESEHGGIIKVFEESPNKLWIFIEEDVIEFP